MDCRQLFAKDARQCKMVEDMVREAQAHNPQVRLLLAAARPPTSTSGQSQDGRDGAQAVESKPDTSGTLPGGQLGASVTKLRKSVYSHVRGFTFENWQDNTTEKQVKILFSKLVSKGVEVQHSPFIQLVEVLGECKEALEAVMGFFSSNTAVCKTQQDASIIARAKHVRDIEVFLRKEGKALAGTLEIMKARGGHPQLTFLILMVHLFWRLLCE